MNISREWAMPTKDTFSCPPIRSFVERYLADSTVSVDPFARNFDQCTYRNDLNSNTAAQYHMDAEDFIKLLAKDGCQVDLAVFDPPYSSRQVKECYESVGRIFTQTDAQQAVVWSRIKDALNDLLVPGGVFLHFGWHTNGMGKKRGYAIEEILLVAHGRSHYDTICMAERRVQSGMSLPYNQSLHTDPTGG